MTKEDLQKKTEEAAILYWHESSLCSESDSISIFKAGAEFGMKFERESKKEILEYCGPHLEQMWAATIIGLILGCDFRDCKQALTRWRERTKE